MSRNPAEIRLPVEAPFTDVARAGARPNIVVICLDQARGDWLGCAGHPLVSTPQIDRIAAAGVRFDRAMSECPVCCPARRVLMTGRDPWGIGMFGNRDTQDFPQGPKLAELFRDAGWQTAAVGKMHWWPSRARFGFEELWLNEEGRTAGLPQGDDYEQFLREHGLAAQAWAHGVGQNQYGVRPSPVPEWATTTGWTADVAQRFLRRRDPARPFLLYVSFDKPHTPCTPPQAHLDHYRDVTFPAPARGDWLDAGVPGRTRMLQHAHGFDPAAWREHEMQAWLRAYAACSSHIDDRIGQILGTLRETQVIDNTWIVITADHGDQAFDHGAFAKGDFATGSCHIPLIVAPARTWQGWQAQRLGGSVRHVAPGLQDVLPTLLDAAGIAAPTGITGQSLVPFLDQAAPTFRSHTIGRCEWQYGISDGRYRLWWLADDRRELLFDLDADPLCTRDLATRDPVTAARLRSALAQGLSARGDERVRDGRLHSDGLDHHLEQAHVRNLWNNRGWR